MRVYLLLFILFASTTGEGTTDDSTEEAENLLEVPENIGDKLRDIVDHFKQPEPVGVPGAPIPDPMAIPDVKYSKSFTTFNLQNPNVYGLSQFRIEHLQGNLADMQIEVFLTYQKVELLGNYTLKSMFAGSSAGHCNVTMVDLYFDGMATLSIARNGHLEASNIKMDIMVGKIMVNFTNLGLIGTLLQGVINSLGSYIFEQIKPYILEEINTNVRGDLNKVMRQLKKTFPNSIPPLDLAIAEGRKSVRESGYDPYMLADYRYTSGFLAVDIKDIWLNGLASFYRVGNITITMSNYTLQIDSHIATQQLEGKCKWKVSLSELLSTTGSTSFTVEYIQAQTKLNQTLDVRNKPRIEELNIRVGNMQLRMDGIGTADYILEMLANVLPNILRYQIVDAVEGMLRQRIQKELDKIDIEKHIEDNIRNFNEMMSPNQTIVPEEFESNENPFDIDQLYEDIDL